ncbi:MAG: DegV family protein [Anaerolineales bacterium]|nr:DegV family protein [Anaerolineales bacterium]MDW8227980.1 DegV family protein [Anaerolineales bacterium]
MNVGLVTDSTADLPHELCRQYDIEVVPALVNMEGRSYEDGVEISREVFYEKLPRLIPPPTTSAPSVGAFQKRYQKLFESGVSEILSIHAASSLSGIFNAARLAAAEFSKRVHVLDSGQLSLGVGFQVLEAAESLFSGVKLEEVFERVERVRQNVRVVALLDTLEYLRRSGRVSWAKARIGALLNLRPLVELRHGVVHRLGQTRTRLQGIQRLKEILYELAPLSRLAILHTNAENAALELLDEVKGWVQTQPFVVNVTTAIGTHVGPNGLGFAAIPAR